MSIRTRLGLLGFLLFSILCALVYYHFQILTILQSQNENLRLQTSLHNAVSELSNSLSEYLIYRDETTKAQWSEKYTALNQLLLEVRRHAPNHELLWKPIDTDIEALQTSFLKLSENFPTAKLPGVGSSAGKAIAIEPNAPPPEILNNAELSRKAASEVLLVTQALNKDVLHIFSDSGATDRQTIDFLTASPFFPVVLVLLAVALMILGLSSPTRNIQHLKTGASRLREGNWGERLPKMKEQELNEIAEALNTMATQLNRCVPFHCQAEEIPLPRVESTDVSPPSQPPWGFPRVHEAQEIFDAVHDVLLCITASGEILSVNQAFKEITGWTSEHWVGQSFQNLVRPEEWEKISALLKEDKNPLLSVTAHLLSKNKETPVLLTAHRVQEEGRPSKFIFVGQPLREDKRLPRFLSLVPGR